MGTATFEPNWWTAQHTSQWDNLKTALRRDWEQTKADLQVGGHELNQGVADTMKQAAGGEPAPPPNVANFDAATNGRNLTWDYAQVPLRYGVGARGQYGAEHAQWGPELESTLRTDWETASGDAKDKWSEVAGIVRHGYERAHH